MFGAVTLTKNADIDQYNYSGYGIGFDIKGEFSFGNGFGKNVIVFGVDLTNSSHANNTKNNILALGKDWSSINFTENNKKFCLSLHYNEVKSYLIINGTEIHKFKAKDSEIVTTPLCLGNVSKDFSVDNMKKNRIKWICLWF